MFRFGLVGAVIVTTLLSAQTQPLAIVGAQFDVVSIKLNTSGSQGGGGRTLPDGTVQFTNRPIATIVAAASPVPVIEVTGLPDWAKTERYDIVAKPAPGSNPTREERATMMRNMLIDRMKLVGHVEEVERPGFALVLARRDGRLGRQLKESTLDCFGADRDRCGGRMGPGLIERNGVLLDEFAGTLRGFVGGVVTNRTGLDGRYDLTLHFAVSTLSADPSAATDDAPQFVTALQEQLGLKLVPEKTKVQIFVIDHIERPTPNN
jgi:uncharacterized protein (TIGR03435 family)